MSSSPSRPTPRRSIASRIGIVLGAAALSMSIGTADAAAKRPARSTVDTTAPSTPAGVTASAADRSITIGWAASTDNVGVVSYAVVAVPADGTSAATGGTSASPLTLQNLVNGVSYTLRVTAVDAVGNTSVPSAPVTATPWAPEPEPEPDPTRDEVPAGALFVSPSGSDSNDGSSASPWRTLDRAMTSVSPGDTVVVRAGTYGARGQKLLLEVSGEPSAPITIMGDPAGPLPTVLGFVRVSGDHLRLRRLLFDGPTGQVMTPTTVNPLGEEVQIAVYGNDIEIANSEIRDNLWHAGIYVEGGSVRITGNYIHHNGNFTRAEQANLDHGIYFARGTGIVANNLIEHNLAHGMQLYPYAADVLVTHNTIVDNGKAGVMVANSAANNLIVNNIVAFNKDNSIRSHKLTGTGNTVATNIVYGNGNGNIGTSADGLTFTGNIVQDPRFVSPTDYRITTTSPAKDAADPNRTMPNDRTGTPRPQGPRPDIGAAEIVVVA